MAGDTFDWNVVIRLALQGDKQARQGMQDIAGAADNLNRQGKVSEATLKSVATASRSAGTAARSAAKDNDLYARSMNSIRYANYDVASTMFTVSAAITAAGVATVTAAASQERAFADVERTTTDSVDGMKQSLTELSTEIPFAFTELAKIATLGNQLGVPAAALEDFTKTIATFSTVTGITAEESAQAFGKLGNLLGVGAEDYDRLASSIALVGRTTAATEKQIISVAGEIAPAAAAAGFTADQVVGLSGALASLKVPPERSRSTILQFFETLNMAVARGGDDLDNFAAVIGMTSEKLESMVRSGQGKDILSQFVSRTAAADSMEITQALDALGLAGLRTNPTIRALAGDLQGLNQAMADGKQGYTENTELQRQMAIILETLSAKWQIFLNAVTNAAAAVGSSAAPALKNLLDLSTDLLVAFADFAQTPLGEFFIKLSTSISVVVGGWALLRGAIALASASAGAFFTATRFLGGVGIMKGLVGMAETMGFYTRATNGATKGTWNLRGAVFALGRATLIGGLFMGLTELIFNTGEAVEWLGQRFADLGNFIGDFASSVSFLPGLEKEAKNLRDFGQSWVEWGKSQKKANEATYEGADALGEFGAGLGDASGGLGDFLNGLDDAAEKVYTLVDYASDLSSVWDRAFDIRFSGQTTLDTITRSFNDIRKAAADAAANIRSLKADIGGLQSDLNIQKYFLRIALEYGDTTRAEAIQANIAKLQADLAKKTEEVTAEQEKNNRTLTGNSAAALTNRETLRGLVQQYQAHIGSLASAGLSQEELARRTEELRQDFIAQATQLGYNAGELQQYSYAFDDVKTAIDRVPRNVTVDFNPDPALQALNEFAARAAEAGYVAGNNFGSGFGDGFEAAVDTKQSVKRGIAKTGLGRSAWRNGGGGSWGRSAGGGGGGGGGGGFAGGGYTGSGPWNQPAGIVHKGEYVVKKAWVDQRTGLPKADALGRLQRGSAGRSGYSGGGLVQGGGGFGGRIEAFGPMAYQQLQGALRQIISVDGKVLADSNSRRYATDTAIGAR